jgi:RecA/RadA recombinase
VNVSEKPILKLSPKPLDAVLGAIIIPQSVSVIHGQEKAPLTILAHALAVAGAKSGYSIFLDSGNNYDPTIVRNLCSKKENAETILSSILVKRIMELNTLEGLSDAIITKDEVNVVVLDSLTQLLNLSSELHTKKRQRILYRALEIFRDMVNRGRIHLVMIDHSTRDWQTKQFNPIGGNVLVHGVDSVVRVCGIGIDEHVRILVERSPIIPSPGSIIIKINPRGIKTIK